jgi:PAS domain S-box-containing protein
VSTGEALEGGSDSSPTGHEFFAGDSRMAERMRTYDWSATSLGDPEVWPQSLRTAVRILLTSRFAMWMCWGPDLTFFCNDAYSPTLGIKQPWALGSSARTVWAEIWPDIGPRIDYVFQEGKATWDQALLLILERSGFREETYHTFSYSPLADEQGVVTGMLCVVTEETERVIGERRMALLRDLASDLSMAQTEQDVLKTFVRCAELRPQDIPFGAVYLFDEGFQRVRRACAVGVDGTPDVTPLSIESNEIKALWPVADILGGAGQLLIQDLATRLASRPTGPWPVPVREAAVAPLGQQGSERPSGFLVCGLNPYRRLDAEYSGFVDLLAGQIAAGIANARAYTAERRRAEELAKLDQAKTTFFSNVSHELRTPLTLMLGPLEDSLSFSKDLPESVMENLDLAHRNSLRLLKLVNNLLDFSRLEAGRVQATFEPLELAAFTAELASNFRSAVERAGLRLEVNCPPLKEPVYADREMWEKVVLNLVSNALKFTLEGEITVSLRAQGRDAILLVSDTGTGIPEAAIPRLFERFYRVENSAGRTHEGTGIGLALVQELVKLHGGDIDVSSKLGTGSKFTVRIPFGKAHLNPDQVTETAIGISTLGTLPYVEEAIRWLPEEAESGPREELQGFETGEILLVDDNADMRQYLQHLLSGRYEVVAVRNGLEALESIAKKRPDLIISDVMMPGLDGFGLLSAIRADPEVQDLPVILLSARAGEEAKVEGLSRGADDYLVKPFSAKELLAKVQSNLRLRQVRKEATEREFALRLEAERASSRFDIILRGVRDQFAVIDQEYRFVFVSDSICETTGMSRDDLLGTTIWESFPHISETPLKDVLETAMRERVHVEAEICYAPFGKWFQNKIYPAPEGGLALLAIDTTERHLVEDTLRESEKMLERRVDERTAELLEANKEMEGFTYTVSHDLRAPLRAIIFNSSLLVEELGENLTKDQRSLLDRQAQSAIKLANLIDDLLKLSRLSRQEMRLESVDLTEIGREVVESIPLASRDGCSVQIQEGLVVKADPQLMHFVLLNLIENACKFSPDGGLVEVGQEVREGQNVYFVRDRGIGFDENYREKIFLPFERLVTEAEFKGTGIGLANVKRIVERHRGRIWAESKPGEGSTFFFTIGEG